MNEFFQEKHTVATLAAYLAKAAPTELLKARAIFTWMAENISFDVNSFFAGKGASDFFFCFLSFIHIYVLLFLLFILFLRKQVLIARSMACSRVGWACARGTLFDASDPVASCLFVF